MKRLIPQRTTWLKAADAILGAVCCLALGRIHYLRHGRQRPPETQPETMRRILVIRPGGLGDMILLLPLLRTLRERRPSLAVDIVCERRNAELLHAIGFDGRVLLYDTAPLRFFRQLRAKPFDVVLDSEQFHHFSAVFAYLSGAPVRIGFKINPRRNALYTHLVNYDLDGPEGLQFQRLLGPLGFGAIAHELEGCLSGFAASADQGGNEPREKPTTGFVAIHAGSHAACKHWAPERFAEVAEHLAKQRGLEIVLTGGNADRRMSMAVQHAAKNHGTTITSVVGRHRLDETAALLRRCTLFVGVDSGIAHLATALDRPSVVIFGPSDHRKWGLENERHAIVRQPVPCAPCSLFGYHKPCRHFACLDGVTTDQVLRACDRVLERGHNATP